MKKCFHFYLTALITLAGTMPLQAQVVCNPMNLSYRFRPEINEPSRREAADPTMVFFQDAYFLFASKTGGYWWSDNLVSWNLVETRQIPTEDYAPTVVAIGDTLYFLASSPNKCALLKSGAPKQGFWQVACDSFPIPVADPALFLDTDRRLYLYWGCSNKDPLYAVELDIKNNFAPLGQPVKILYPNPKIHGWENPGDYNELTAQAPWIEGAWVNKFESNYYLQYAGPGTEFKSYADGVYVSPNPLGPFKLQKHNPFACKPEGFVCGAGHGSTFTDRYGNIWHIGTMTISVKHMFERRLGLFPAFLDQDGELFAYTGLGDYPFLIPQKKIKSPAELSLDWMLLSYKKKITASSCLDTHPAQLANDEDIRSFWSADTHKKGQWLQIDLGALDTINALQVNFAESAATIKARTSECYYQYQIEGAADGRQWKLLIDKSTAVLDTPHDFVVFEKPLQTRYVRISGLYVPDGYFALSDLRIFGKAHGGKPACPAQCTAIRDTADRRVVKLTWDSVKEATGYNIRYGADRGKRYSDYMIYGKHDLVINSLHADHPYYFSITAFNENGQSQSSPIIEIE